MYGIFVYSTKLIGNICTTNKRLFIGIFQIPFPHIVYLRLIVSFSSVYYSLSKSCVFSSTSFQYTYKFQLPVKFCPFYALKFFIPFTIQRTLHVYKNMQITLVFGPQTNIKHKTNIRPTVRCCFSCLTFFFCFDICSIYRFCVSSRSSKGNCCLRKYRCLQKVTRQLAVKKETDSGRRGESEGDMQLVASTIRA